MHRRLPAASSMIGGDIVSIGSPDRLAIAPFAEESHPDHKSTAIGPEAVRRMYAMVGQARKNRLRSRS